MLLNECKDISEFSACPTAEILPTRVDSEGRIAVVVEGAKPFEGLSGGTQSDIGANDIDDVVGRFNPLDHS